MSAPRSSPPHSAGEMDAYACRLTNVFHRVFLLLTWRNLRHLIEAPICPIPSRGISSVCFPELSAVLALSAHAPGALLRAESHHRQRIKPAEGLQLSKIRRLERHKAIPASIYSIYPLYHISLLSASLPQSSKQKQARTPACYASWYLYALVLLRVGVGLKISSICGAASRAAVNGHHPSMAWSGIWVPVAAVVLRLGILASRRHLKTAKRHSDGPLLVQFPELLLFPATSQWCLTGATMGGLR